jgi:glycerol-3-phosphate dehydrogenase (NAD(P)+)
VLAGQQKPIFICAKGFEVSSGLLLSQMISEVMPNQEIGFLSGPSFAHDIMAGRPSAIALAMEQEAHAKIYQDVLSTPQLRLYRSTDIIGVQVAGAMKNVIAIACGICAGLNLGESARAALVTRGLAEMGRLVLALGGQRETLMGLSGFGDLVLTCSSPSSRNFSFGFAIGQGQKMEDILSSRKSVTEGILTAQAALKLARVYHLSMPITEAVVQIVSGQMDPQDCVLNLLSRPASID